MEQRVIGKTGKKASVLGFGCMRLPCLGGGNAGENVDMEEAVRMIRYAVDNGVNYVDTAYPYHNGKSEVAVGCALKNGYRGKVMIADKSPVFFIEKESDFNNMLEEQLRRLDDEYIDFYLLHSLSKETYENIVLKFDLIGKAERAKKAGKIGHIGFSFHDNYEAFEMILNGYDSWEFCQIQLNYLDETRQAGLKGLKAAAAKGLGVMIMEPLMGGKLANPPREIKEIFDANEKGVQPVKWALDYLWNMPEVSLVLSGMSTMQQTIENVEYAKNIQRLTDRDQITIAKVKEQFEKMITVPCTGCGYCMPCPQGVSIPSNFAAYNEIKLYGPETARATFDNMLLWEGENAQAPSCVGCKACEGHCPQKIQISSHMPKIVEAFSAR